MSSLLEPHYTPEQYLELERKAAYKSEYLDGEIFAMAGVSIAHNLGVANVVGELRTQLKGGPCLTFPSDLKVETGPNGLFAYPDVSVVCGEPRFHDKYRDVILNLVLVVEVLSPSTEAYDRGAKFAQYRRLESLTDYLLISTVEKRVDHFVRQADNRWLLSEVTDAQGTVPIDSLGCTLEIAEVYDRVTFTLPASTE